MKFEDYAALSMEEKIKLKERNNSQYAKSRKIVGIGKNGNVYYRKVEKIIPASHKYCNGCNQILPENCFYRSNYSPDGLTYLCKSCTFFVEKERKEKQEREYKKWKENR